MKKFAALLVLQALLLVSAVAQTVSIGMDAAELLKVKGEPDSKASVGKRSIYRWPDVQVTFVDGKVQSFQLRDQAAEKAKEREKTRAAQQKKTEDAKAARERVLDARESLAEARRDAAATNRATEERLHRAAFLQQQIRSIEKQLEEDSKRSNFRGPAPMSAEARAYLTLRLENMRRELADLR